MEQNKNNSAQNENNDQQKQGESDLEQVDALTFFKKKSKSPETQVSETKNTSDVLPRIPGPDEDYYRMDYPKRGTAIIFNHYTFADYELSDRKGTDVDEDALIKILSGLGFQIQVFRDSKYATIMTRLHTLSQMDHSEHDCLAVFVMTHGDDNILHSYDEPYAPKNLWEPFKAESCPTLAGKPKLFFIQACRGENVDKGRKVQLDGPAEKKLITILPNFADILVMYPTQEGHLSFRSPEKGTWFIQTLCEELKNRVHKQDLLTILTFVNRKLALGYQSFNPKNKELHLAKQVGSIVSSLTRLVFFGQLQPINHN